MSEARSGTGLSGEQVAYWWGTVVGLIVGLFLGVVSGWWWF